MIRTFYLAYRYVHFHRLRSLLLFAALTLTMMLPLTTRWTMERLRGQTLMRADSTPMIIGARGSSLGLALHTLYYHGDVPPTFPFGQFERLSEVDGLRAVPMLARFRSQGHLIVGTNDDYLAFRQLTLSDGQPLAQWGECLVGWQAARDLDIQVGDGLLSEPENMLDPSGPAPLKLRVCGILQRTRTSDDDVIFCHLETAWIMAGIGHGHAVTATESSHAHGAENLQRYSEVTAENRFSFHFHGNRTDYPLTAIIAIPDSDRTAAILEGKYLSTDEPCQVVLPSQAIRDMLRIVARVQQLLDAVSLLLGLATLLMLVLVLWLSLKLREKEIHTLKLLGASRWKTAQIMLAELLLILAVSLVAAGALSGLVVVNLDVLRNFFA